MSKIIWMEILLLGASILVFRSVWEFLDLCSWARSKSGLIVLFVIGAYAFIFALKKIHLRR